MPPKTPPPVISESAKQLQDALHQLLSRLADTSDKIKSWPEAKGDDASIHVESTSQLISKIRSVIQALERVENCYRNDTTLRSTLQKCRIPLDLLDLLDSSRLNPDCFSRGLLREALGQLAGLKRRKLALELLGSAVQTGIDQKDTKSSTASHVSEPGSFKRERDTTSDDAGGENDGKDPAPKKMKVEDSS